MKGLLFVALALVLILVLYVLPFRTGFVVRNTSSLDSYSNPSSPNNWVNESQIEIHADKVVIRINNSELSRFGNTSSMLPLIGKAANGIAIKPQEPEQIHIGDIIAFEQDAVLVVHRVVEVGDDEQGWYAITKGDNTEQEDGRIRFEQIKYVIVVLIY